MRYEWARMSDGSCSQEVATCPGRQLRTQQRRVGGRAAKLHGRDGSRDDEQYAARAGELGAGAGVNHSVKSSQGARADEQCTHEGDVALLDRVRVRVKVRVRMRAGVSDAAHM